MTGNLLAFIIWAFTCNCHIMNMTFTKTSTCNLYKFCLFWHLTNMCATCIAHRSTKTTNKLMQNQRNWPFIRCTSFNTFRDKLLMYHGLLFGNNDPQNHVPSPQQSPYHDMFYMYALQP